MEAYKEIWTMLVYQWLINALNLMYSVCKYVYGLLTVINSSLGIYFDFNSSELPGNAFKIIKQFKERCFYCIGINL